VDDPQDLRLKSQELRNNLVVLNLYDQNFIVKGHNCNIKGVNNIVFKSITMIIIEADYVQRIRINLHKEMGI
jgi:hypothetical protein